jgi:hypothetical protein
MNTNGFSILVCFGRYAGFHALNDWPALRLVLGWVSVSLIFRDVDLWMEKVNLLLGDVRIPCQPDEHEWTFRLLGGGDLLKVCKRCQREDIQKLKTPERSSEKVECNN